MKITYDTKIDALNISLKSVEISRTIEIALEVFVDLDSKGAPLYVRPVAK